MLKTHEVKEESGSSNAGLSNAKKKVGSIHDPFALNLERRPKPLKELRIVLGGP